MAEDDSRVAKVSVVIKSLTSGQYYNGQAWQNSWTRLSAVTLAKNQPVSSWNLLTHVQLPDGIDDDFLFVSARAIDANGNFGSVAWTVKPIDQAPPTAKIDPGLRGKRFPTSRATLFGTYSDNYEILSVRIVVRNIDRHYWNGNAWVDQWSFVEADLDPAGIWQFQNVFSNGFYTVTARAMDTAFNWQKVPANSYFTVAN